MPAIYSLLIYIFICTAALTAHAAKEAPLARYHTLIQEIRCVVCQGQNLADSNAPLAQDMRQKIYTMTLQNQSDEAIKSYLVKRYGDFILLRPRWTSSTIFLWVFPLIGIVVCFWVFLRNIYATIHE